MKLAYAAPDSPNFITFFTCGAEGTRTPDPLHAMQVRYQLRHSPLKGYLVVGVVILREGKAYPCPTSGHLLGQPPEVTSRCIPEVATAVHVASPFQ